MLRSALKRILPEKAIPLRILRGPFRGATVCMNPRDSLRKVFGLYEHELNEWLDQVLTRVDCIIDVGANDGYFTFGCAAAFRRMEKEASILAFEPQEMSFCQLEQSLIRQPKSGVAISLHQQFVGKCDEAATTTLDSAIDDFARSNGARAMTHALIKIDVEGAELDVIDGAREALYGRHYFLIEVHCQSYLATLRDRFATAGRQLIQINQRALPLIGGEHRSETNCWLVSALV